MNKRYYTILITLLAALPLAAQFHAGQKAYSFQFLGFNTTNDYTQRQSGFSKTTGTGLSVSLGAGHFVKENIYLGGQLASGYNYNTRIIEDAGSLGLRVDKSSYSNFYVGLGAVGRKYYPANNWLGLYLQAQAGGTVTYFSGRDYVSQSDTVLSDGVQKYPIYSFDVHIIPGVYVDLTSKWQLNFNIGDLYFTQNFRPARKGEVNREVHSSFGMNFNLFDFRLSLVYMPGRVRE